MVVNLNVHGGSFGYSEIDLFRDVNLDVEGSEVLTILGPNGAGKTTLLKCIMGFLPWRSGRSELNGRVMESYTAKQLTKHMAYVPQMKAPSFDYSVREMVLMGRAPHIRLYDQPGDDDRRIVSENLEMLGISHLSDRRFNTLSGGEMQLAMIARALVSEPEILILDEPESNLDYSNQLKVLDLIEEVSKDIACIINTHYPEHALRISDKTLILDGKGDYIYGKTKDVITEENLLRTFSIHARIGSMQEGSDTYSYIVPIRRVKG